MFELLWVSAAGVLVCNLEQIAMLSADFCSNLSRQLTKGFMTMGPAYLPTLTLYLCQCIAVTLFASRLPALFPYSVGARIARK